MNSRKFKFNILSLFESRLIFITFYINIIPIEFMLLIKHGQLYMADSTEFNCVIFEKNLYFVKNK